MMRGRKASGATVWRWRTFQELECPFVVLVVFEVRSHDDVGVEEGLHFCFARVNRDSEASLSSRSSSFMVVTRPCTI